jgi:NAD(P)-dependent dehydrogenase (short-subunit alcohol dehydrogenase family)
MEPLVILVTGSTDGIGRQSALELAAQGHRVVLHGRDPQRLEAAREAVAANASGPTPEAVCADLSVFDSVAEMAGTLRERYDRIDVLVNNAGVFQRHRRLTADGMETTLAVNHLAPFLLTGRLLDRLTAAPAGRIVNLTSTIHAQAFDPDVFLDPKAYDGFLAYSQSKLFNILFTLGLSERLQGTKVTANCLHPGVINTKLLRETWHGGDSVSKGARASTFVATNPSLAGVSGVYFVDGRPTRPARVALDETVRRRLWELSETWTGYRYTA